MAAGLHPRAEDRQDRRVPAGETLRRDRRDGGGAHLGDEPAVHGGEWLAGLGPKEQDQRVMGRDAPVAGIESDELGAEGGRGGGGHGGEESLVAP